MNLSHLKIICIHGTARYLEYLFYGNDQLFPLWIFINVVEMTLYSAFYEVDFIKVLDGNKWGDVENL